MKSRVILGDDVNDDDDDDDVMVFSLVMNIIRNIINPCECKA